MLQKLPPRRLAVSEMLDDSVHLYRSNSRRLLSIAALGLLPERFTNQSNAAGNLRGERHELFVELARCL